MHCFYITSFLICTYFVCFHSFDDLYKLVQTCTQLYNCVYCFPIILFFANCFVDKPFAVPVNVSNLPLPLSFISSEGPNAERPRLTWKRELPADCVTYQGAPVQKTKLQNVDLSP